MNAQPPPPPPPPPPPEEPTAQQARPPAQPPARAFADTVGPEPGGPAKAGAGLRILGVIAALVLLFAAAVLVILSVDYASATTCREANRDLNFTGDECFDGSTKRQILTLVFLIPSALLTIAAFVLTMAFVIRGYGAKRAGLAFLAAAVLFGLAELVTAI